MPAMKKIASVFCACLAFAFFASGAGAQEKSLEAKNAELQAQIAQLEAKVKELEKQLVDQVEKDMKILGRLRAENRELKGQIRKIRMDEAVAAQAKDPADIQAAVDAAAAMRREKVAAEENFDKAEAAKTERAVRARQRAEEAEKKAEERGEKKSGGFWDNAFPF